MLNSLTLKSLKEHLIHQPSKSEKDIQLVKRRSIESLVYSSIYEIDDLNGYPNSFHTEIRNREMSLVKISIVIIIIFIVCHSIRWIPNTYELIQHVKNGDFQWPNWIKSFTHVSHLLTTFNSSIIFYIYIFRG